MHLRICNTDNAIQLCNADMQCRFAYKAIQYRYAYKAMQYRYAIKICNTDMLKLAVGALCWDNFSSIFSKL